MARRSEPHSISIERRGKTVHGHYYIEGKMVHVSCPFGSKTTQIGGMTAEGMARQLLLEIVAQSQE